LKAILTGSPPLVHIPSFHHIKRQHRNRLPYGLGGKWHH
jgi:hypothetical protein